MSMLVFKLNNVELDEADEVRDLLEENEVDFYETSSGRWGISVAGIWVKDKVQFARARELIDVYQSERIARLADQEGGGILWSRFIAAPAQVLSVLLVIFIVIYVSLFPFVGW